MQVWKKGVLMRVDGSLMGIDDKANTLIPQWKRGHFSLLFDGRPTPATLLLVDHRKGTLVDLTKEKRKHRPDIDDEVSKPTQSLYQRTEFWEHVQHALQLTLPYCCNDREGTLWVM